MVDEIGLWEFGEAVSGWRAFNSTEDQSRPPTPEEHDEMVAKYTVH